MKHTVASFFNLLLLTASMAACQIVELKPLEEISIKREEETGNNNSNLKIGVTKAVYLPIDRVALVQIDGVMMIAASTFASTCGIGVEPEGLSLSFDGNYLDVRIKSYQKSEYVAETNSADQLTICPAIYSPGQVKLAEINDYIGRHVTVRWKDGSGRIQTGDLDAWSKEISYPSYVATKEIDFKGGVYPKWDDGGCFEDENGNVVCAVAEQANDIDTDEGGSGEISNMPPYYPVYTDIISNAEKILTELEVLKLSKTISMTSGGMGFCQYDYCVESYDGRIELFLGRYLQEDKFRQLKEQGYEIDFVDINYVDYGSGYGNSYSN